ncbi:exosome complex component RRP40-like [Ptychodera flava]|uniref:exosome complex component RRP40-like n=1 Tax=Ptychodera flava TaxID=63121 RepID=UPI00396A1D6E
MAEHVNSVVLPGDILTELSETGKRSKLRLGPGLRLDAENVVVCKCGILRQKEENVYWVDTHQKRYVPVKGENVLGIITTKAGDIFKVDVGTNEQATLSYLAFEGATKKNRPNVQIGDLVYAKFLVANKDMEPELVCIDSAGRSNGLGVISGGGFVFQCPLGLVRKILSPDCQLLKLLGKHMPFEIAVGLNGRVWVKARTIDHTIAICNAISSVEFMTENQIKIMVNQLVSVVGWSSR